MSQQESLANPGGDSPEPAVKKGRSTGTAFALWFFLGFFGGHMFYLGEKKRGIVFAFLTVFSLLALFSAFYITLMDLSDALATGPDADEFLLMASTGLFISGAATSLGVMFAWISDAFRIPAVITGEYTYPPFRP